MPITTAMECSEACKDLTMLRDEQVAAASGLSVQYVQRQTSDLCFTALSKTKTLFLSWS